MSDVRLNVLRFKERAAARPDLSRIGETCPGYLEAYRPEASMSRSNGRMWGDSGANFNGRAVLDELPYFIHDVIGDGNAALGPILLMQPVLRPLYGRNPTGAAMNHDAATRAYIASFGLGDIVFIRIRN